jgi:hypothetical protein
MGVGFGFGLVTDYYNIIDQLFLQGFTASRAFGLDLGSVDEAQGFYLGLSYMIAANIFRVNHLWRYRYDEIHQRFVQESHNSLRFGSLFISWVSCYYS